MRESNDGNVDRLESVASEGKKGDCVNCGGEMLRKSLSRKFRNLKIHSIDPCLGES